MLDPFKARTRAWIEEGPTLSPAAVLQRLMSADPSRFTKKFERTLQIAARAWRAEITGQIIINGDWIKGFAVSSPASAGDDTRTSLPVYVGTIFDEATGGAVLQFGRHLAMWTRQLQLILKPLECTP